MSLTLWIKGSRICSSGNSPFLYHGMSMSIRNLEIPWTFRYQFNYILQRFSVGNVKKKPLSSTEEMVSERQNFMGCGRRTGTFHRAVLVAWRQEPPLQRKVISPDEKNSMETRCCRIIFHESVFHVSLGVPLCDGSEHLLCRSSLLIIFVLKPVRN